MKKKKQQASRLPKGGAKLEKTNKRLLAKRRAETAAEANRKLIEQPSIFDAGCRTLRSSAKSSEITDDIGPASLSYATRLRKRTAEPSECDDHVEAKKPRLDTEYTRKNLRSTAEKYPVSIIRAKIPC